MSDIPASKHVTVEVDSAAIGMNPQNTLVCLWKCRDSLLMDLRAHDILPFLRQGHVISLEEEEMVMHEVTTRGQAERLFWMLCQKLEDRSAYECFFRGLQDTYPHLAELLENVAVTAEDETDFQAAFTKQGFPSGDVLDAPEGNALDVTEAELRHIYIHQMAYLAPVPWNQAFRVPMSHVFTSLCTVNIAQPHWGSKSLSELVRGLHEDGVGIDDLLSSAECHHTIVEGEPGIGKTTLCHKLAYDWATLSTHQDQPLPSAQHSKGSSSGSSVAGIHRFKLVFFMEARCLEEESLIDCIYLNLLPENFVVSKELLAMLLEQPNVQERVLFIIDAYDELSQGNEQLKKLIERRIHSRCSLIITTRPTYANSIINHVDAMYVIIGYPLQKRKEFIRKYVDETKADMKMFRMLERNLLENDTISDLSRNPLYLWFLCMLVEDNEGRLPETRTELFQEVVSLLLRKARVKLKLAKTDCDAYFECLCRLAFESHKQGKVHFNQALLRKFFPFDDISVLGKLGFLTREMTSSRLHPNLLFTFTHKTIQEFLATNYLLSICKAKRIEFVQKRRKERHWWMVWIFLSGLLQGDDQALETHYQSAICKDLSATVDMATGFYSTDRVHDNYHLGLQCLGESGLFKGFSVLGAQIVPPTFVYHVMACHYCLQGFLMAHSEGIPEHQPDLVINGLDLEMYRMFDYKLLDAMSGCSNLQSLVIAEVMSLNLLMDYLSKFFASGLRLKRLFVYISQAAHPEIEPIRPAIKGLVFESAESLEVLVLKGTFLGRLKGAESIAQGLEFLLVLLLSNLGPTLKSLALDSQTMTARVTAALLERIPQCSNLKQLHFQNLCFAPDQFELLIGKLRVQRRITNLHLLQCSTQMLMGQKQEVPDNLPELIESCPLEELVLVECGLSMKPNVEAVLAKLTQRTTLRHIEIISNYLSRELRSKLRNTLLTNPQLQTLILCDIGTVGDDVADMATLFNHLTSLRHLDLSHSDIGAPEPFSKFTAAIQCLPNLRTLKLNTCNITDDSLHHLGIILDKVPITELSLLGNAIGVNPDGVQGIQAAFEAASHLENVSLTCVQLTAEVGLALGATLSRNRSLKVLNLLCTPTLAMFEPKAYKVFYRAMFRTLPSLQDFSVGCNPNIKEATLYRKTDHAYYRKACAEQ